MDILTNLIEFLFPAVLHSAGAIILMLWLIFGRHLLISVMDKEMQTPEMLNLRVFKIDTTKEQLERESKHSWFGAVSIAVLVYLAIISGSLKLAESTFLNTLTTFVVFYVWVEVSYYFLHRAMHEFKTLYVVHREHHSSVIPTAQTTLAASFIEEWIITALPWVAFIAGASWMMDISFAGLIVYFIFNFFISVGGHINTENSPVSLTMAKFTMSSPTDHSLHHARFTVNYGFSNILLDRFFGTYCDETDDLRLRALAGNGNTTLKRPGKNKSRRENKVQSASMGD